MDQSFRYAIDNNIIKERYSQENEYLYFYKNMYNGLKRLEWIYNSGYRHSKIMYNICKKSSANAAYKEMIELTAIVPCMLSILIGFNREDLQNTNSKISNRNLFQYANYENTSSIVDLDGKSSMTEMSKQMCRMLKFNTQETGPFPYMLEINKSDGRERPYDCITKIRNALEHAEYYQKKGDIHTITIFNHDDDNNLTFQGRILEWPFRYFIEDYYGLGLGVASNMHLFEMPKMDRFTSKKDLIIYLMSSTCTVIEFTKIPNDLTFKGSDALFAQLNSAFTYGGVEKTSFEDILQSLKEQGLEYSQTQLSLSEEEVKDFVIFLETNYKDKLYNNVETFKEINNFYKLYYCPNKEIANSFNNIFRFIDFRKQYLYNGIQPNETYFGEQIEDEFTKEAFKISFTLIKIGLVNYLLECKNIELPDLSQLDITNFNVEPINDFKQKINIALQDGIDPLCCKQYVILNTIRNALAHGGDRVKIVLGNEIKLQFSDIYNGKKIIVTSTLDNLDNIYSNNIFNPENQVVKEQNKIKA